MTRHLVQRTTATVIAIACFMVAGCHHGGGEPIPRTIEQAPFRLGKNGRLEVTESILPKLTFSTATTSSLVAELHGVGEVDFSPGALTAMRIPFDGIVESVDVTAGETVTAGQQLARVRSSELARMRADIQRIESTLVGQRDALRRSRELVQADAISSRRIIELESTIGALEAEKGGSRSPFERRRHRRTARTSMISSLAALARSSAATSTLASRCEIRRTSPPS